ncbi:MAG: S41 family peptidase [Bacteroidota bacterium]
MIKRNIKILALLLIVVGGIATTSLNRNDKLFEIAKNIELFANLYREINTYYVDELEPAQLMKTGVDAMVNSLDPYTNYLSESQIEGYRFITEGRYNGIGAASTKIGDFLTIVELYEDQPADKAGLKVGDQVLAVDGKDARGKNAEAVEEILQGFPGTEVDLLIHRPGESGNRTITLVREEVKIKNVPYYSMLDENIGYVALTTFTRAAGENVADAVRDLQAENPDMKGVVLDLRGNGGGLLMEAVNVSNVFLPKNKLIVTTKGKVREWDRSFSTSKASVDEEIPLVVLINNRSASASEIVCGSIQDYDRGVLLGQRSYGKGLVQNHRDIGYNAKVKLTTAKYYIPSGRCIQAVEYENGEPVDISEDKRTPFNTINNGRVVYDGGGVKPDLVIDKDGSSNILKTLQRAHIVFDYVTKYCQGKSEMAAVEDLYFKDFDDFVAYVGERNFDYDTKTEGLLKKLEEQAVEDGYQIKAELEAARMNILATKRAELLKYKEPIIDMIEKEIAGRYYYQRGKVKIGLRNDEEVQQAIVVLNDEEKYSSLLKN